MTCVGLLVAEGLAVAAPAWAAEVSGTKNCPSTQQPYLTTTRGTNIVGATTLHQWSKSGVATQSSTGTAVTFSSSYVGVSSGGYYASTAASSLTVDSITCGSKAV